MRKRSRVVALAVVLFVLVGWAIACGSRGHSSAVRALDQDQVLAASLADIRLGDGVPVTLGATVRWRAEKPERFVRQFTSGQAYGEQVLTARAREIAGRIASSFPTVDGVFTTERERFVQELKKALGSGLTEPGVAIKEVILSDVGFPQRFTDAMELVALKDLELDAIQQRSQVELEESKAAELQAEAEGEVAIKRAQTDAKVAEINAQAEEKRRQSALARAETEAQISERNARTEAQRVRELAKAEVEKRQALDQAEVAKQREVAKAELEKRAAADQLDLTKTRELDKLARDKDLAQAEMYASNPAYASFQVNRELASKVQIAVLPIGADTGMLGGLIQNAMGGRSK